MKTITNPVSTQNRYAVLSDDEEEATSSQVVAAKKIKIPPIVTINMTMSSIKAALNSIKVSNYHVKYMSIGIKIITYSTDDYKKTVKKLKQDKNHFFSHDIPSESTTKFILSGLPDFDIEEVKEGLINEDIAFLDVKKMQIKNARYQDEARYIIYFANKTITLNDLKRKPYILRVRIRWQKYVSSRNGPTQCNNCQLYGHGAKNCNTPPRCVKCAGKHETGVCIKDMDPTTSFQPKCCLCGQPHMANDKACPTRLEYIKMRLNNSYKTNQNPTNLANPQKRTPLQIYNPSQHQPINPVNPHVRYSHWLKQNQQIQQSSPPTHQHPHSPLPPHQNTLLTMTQQNPSSSGQNLFNPQELMEMTMDLISALRNCQNKFDQFQAIASVAIRFAVQNP